MLPTRYWINPRTIQKQKQLCLPLVKKLTALPAAEQLVPQQKEVIAQFAITEDGTPIIIKTELTPLTK